MTGAETLDYLLAALLLGVAGWSIAARSTVTAVICFVVCGLILALIWVRLSAVDVALTEAAIGGGVTGVLLFQAADRLRGVGAPQRPPSASLRCVAAILAFAVTAAIAVIVVLPAAPAPTLAPAAIAGLAKLDLGNPVTGVLLAYRALDTLVEAVVLLIALLGVWSLTPDRLWGGAPAMSWRAEPSGALTLVAQVLPPIGIVVGIYVVWTGAKAPGGAFQGGAILAAMWILAMVAGLLHPSPIARRRLRLMLVAGPAVFIAIGIAALPLTGSVLAYPVGFAKPLIVLIEAALTLSIAATLGMMVAGVPATDDPA